VAPRAAVLGLDLVLASGVEVRCGGRVVKNVTGYDLAKLYVGALGSLGVIEAAWLRLRPAPERVEWRHALLRGEGDADSRVLEAARHAAVRAALLSGATGGTGGPQLLLELAGDDAVVEAADRRLREALGAAPAARDDLVAAFAPAVAEGSVLRFRLSVLPARLAAVTRALADAGARWLALPAHGLCWARFELSSPPAEPFVAAAVEAVRDAARAGGGHWLLEAAPPRAKHATDVFGDVSATLPLMRALKDRFDPGGVLNPGRFAGRL
jgi:glycolate oxidase FAD binding subunit